jgi:energy-coupling factor transporter ATP-binding protein EcfA2
MTSPSYHPAVIWDVDLTLREPRLAAIVAEWGLQEHAVKAVLGLVPMASGRVEIFGQPVAKVRQRIGYVPQRESVDWDFPVSVLDVVLMGTYGQLGWIRRPGKAERDWARRCLEKVGLVQYERQQIGQLSGGQQQRVFLARALAQKADLYFMDEPMAGVDAATERMIFTCSKNSVRPARRSSPSTTTCGPCRNTSTTSSCSTSASSPPARWKRPSRPKTSAKPTAAASPSSTPPPKPSKPKAGRCEKLTD